MIYLLWLFYLVGWVTVILDRAYKSSKNPLTPWDNVGAYFKQWLPGIIKNFAISTALFISVSQTTSFLTQGIPGTGSFSSLPIPLVKAVLFGIASDKISDLVITAGTFALNKAKAVLPSGDANDTPKP